MEMQFADVPMGALFFDPESGEYFSRVSGGGIFQTGGNHFEDNFAPFAPGDIVDTVDEEEYNHDQPDDSMDGDFDSAMASAGLGTDEDYGYFGSDE